MGEYKKLVMEAEEELIRRAFNEWEIEKILKELSLHEIDELCKKIDAEKAKRSEEQDESSATA